MVHPMPLPILIPIAILISVPFSILSSWLLYKLIDWIKEEISRRNLRIVCLGENVTGKTTFINFLLHGEITKIYRGTLQKEFKEGKKIKMADLKIRIHDFNDLGGSDLNYPQWKEEFIKSDICFYIVDIQKWKNDDNNCRERVSKDLARLAHWCEGDKQHFIFYLFNFCDLLPDYSPSNPMKIQDILTREFKEYNEQQLIKCRSRKAYAACSMHIKYIETSVLYILKMVATSIKNKEI